MGRKILFSLFLMFTFCSSYSLFGEKIDKIIAIVNDDVITEEELNLAIKMMALDEESDVPAEGDIRSFKETLLIRMIEDRLILQEAKRLQIKVDEKMVGDRIDDIKQRAGGELAFEDALNSEDISLNELKEKLTNQLMIFLVIEQEVKNKIHVSPKEVTDFFKAHPEQFVVPETAIVDSIFVPERQALEKVESELGQGKAFGEVANMYSKKSNLGEVRRGQLKKELEDFIFSLEPGQCSRPFEVDDGFYIFLVKEKHAPSSKTIEEVKDRIILLLQKIKIDKKLKEWLEGLKEKAYISVRE